MYETSTAGIWREGDPLPLVEAIWEETDELTSERCRAIFDSVEPFTLGIEEELMLVDTGTLELAPVIGEVLDGLPPDGPFRKELRAAQIEIVTPVCATAADACRELAAAREALVEHVDGRCRLLAAGTHPTSSEQAWGEVAEGDRYQTLAGEYAWAARRSLACGLHVHVAVGGADRTLAVYNALRSYIPAFGALAANSPFLEGRDTGMCSIRTKLHEAFVRAGVPPAFADWDAYADFVEWGRRGGLYPDSSHFWWDLRLHPAYGTIELRVADAQTRVADNAAIAAVFHAVVIRLARMYDAGVELPVDDHFRLHENTWRGIKDGLRGWLVDTRTGERVPTRVHLARLLDDL